MTSPRDTFRSLHEAGIFVMANPWDRGSARILEEAGFPALATTSAGYGRSIGKDDQEVGRHELVAHVADLTDILRVPLSVDSERLFPVESGGIAETVRQLADAGASGCSIEDYEPATRSIDPIERATAAVAEAASACAEHGLVLTARAENHLYLDTSSGPAADADVLADTIARLRAYAAAGAEVLYAPGLRTAADIGAVIETIDRPLNVLALPDGPPVPELQALGVRRVSIGSSMYSAAMRTLRRAAAEVLDHGTSHYAR